MCNTSHLLEVSPLVLGSAGAGGPEELVSQKHNQRGHEGECSTEGEHNTDGKSQTEGADDLEVADDHGSESNHDGKSGGEDGLSGPDDGLFGGFDVLQAAPPFLPVPGQDEDTVIASRSQHGGEQQHLHDVEDVEDLTEEEQGAQHEGVCDTDGHRRCECGYEGPEEQSDEEQDQEDGDGLHKGEIPAQCLSGIVRDGGGTCDVGGEACQVLSGSGHLCLDIGPEVTCVIGDGIGIEGGFVEDGYGDQSVLYIIASDHRAGDLAPVTVGGGAHQLRTDEAGGGLGGVVLIRAVLVIGYEHHLCGVGVHHRCEVFADDYGTVHRLGAVAAHTGDIVTEFFRSVHHRVDGCDKQYDPDDQHQFRMFGDAVC